MTDNQPTEAMVEAAAPGVTLEMVQAVVEAELDDVLSNSDGGAPSTEKQQQLDAAVTAAWADIIAALSHPAQEPVAFNVYINGWGEELLYTENGAKELITRLRRTKGQNGEATITPLYAAPQPTHDTSALSTLQSPDKERGDPFAYMRTTLTAIADGHKQSQIDELLPWSSR